MLRDDLIAFLDDLEKGANHKYIRRIPTGKPKPRYRYIYDARKAVDTKARPQVGEKIKIEHNGQAGHYEVKRVMRDGRSVVQHDETGHRMVIRNAQLHDLVRAAHAPADPQIENARLDEKHSKVDLLPRSRKDVLNAIKQASGIDDHDLAQADAEYAAWKGRGRKGPKPQRAPGKGGELDAFSADLKRGQRFSSLLEAFEHATKGAKTWRDIAPIVSQLREVPGFENAHLPEDALLRHAMQDEERRSAPDSKHPNPEDFGTTVPKSVDEQGFDWNTGEQHPAMATPAEARSTKKRAKAAKAAKLAAPPPAPTYTPTDPDAPDAERPAEDASGDASFDFGANAPEEDDDMWRSQHNLVIDLSKAFDGAPSTTVSRQNTGKRQGEGSRGGHIVGHTPGGDPIYAKAGGPPSAPGAKPGADPHAEFAKLQAAHQQAMAQMQQAHAAMLAHAQKHGITMPGSTQTGAHDPTRVSQRPGGTQTGPTDPTRIQHSVARGPSADPESTGVVAPQKPAEKTATKKGPTDHLTGPASGESPEESVPKADGILEHGIVGHTSSGKQIKLGMNHETLSPREAHEASLLHREAQEHLLNAGRHSPNPTYKKAARAHLDEEFALASKAVTGQTEAAHYVDPDEEQIGSVFSSAKKSLAGWEAFSSWSPSAMWAGEDIGITFGARLEKALGGERAGHKYIKRTPRAGGGYDYEYADTPHSKETLKGAPLGSQLEVEHNGETATYTKVGRDDWKGAVGGAIASGWFVGKPGTLTHGAPHPEPASAPAGKPFTLTAAPVQQGLFGASSFEKKPEPKKPDLSQDPRQQGMFAAPSPMAQAAAEAEKQPATGKYGPLPKSPGLTEADREMIARTTGKPESVLKRPPIDPKVARQLGRDAANADLGPYPHAHEPMRKLMEGGAIGEHVEAMKAWHSGWMQANVSKPVEEEPKPSPMAEATKEAEKQPAPEPEREPSPEENRAMKANADREKHMAIMLERAKERLDFQGPQFDPRSDDYRQLEDAVAAAQDDYDAARETTQQAQDRVNARLRGEGISLQRKHEFGSHVGGSRKDVAEIRKLVESGQLDKVTPAEAARYLHKASAMPALTPEHFRSMGATAGAAHAGTVLASLVAAKPGDSAEERASYLEGVRMVAGALQKIRTAKDAREFQAECRAHVDNAGERERTLTPAEAAVARYSGGYTREKAAARDALLSKISAEVGADRGIAVGETRDGRVFVRWTNHKEREAVHDMYRALGQRFIAGLNLRVPKKGAWSRNASRWGSDTTFGQALSVADTLDAHVDGPDAAWQAFEMMGAARTVAKAGLAEERKARKEQSAGETSEERMVKWKQTISDTPDLTGTKKRVSEIDHRSDTALFGAQDRVGQTFGFTSVQPGESLLGKTDEKTGKFSPSKKGREDYAYHLQHAEMAFHDLADVLGLSPEQVSLNGKLALAIAARGRGGKVAAHYESDHKVINVTRFRGAGTIAHEWGHFLDNVMAEMHGAKETSRFGSYASHGHGAQGMSAELAGAVRGVMDAIKNAPANDARDNEIRQRMRKDEIRETTTRLAKEIEEHDRQERKLGHATEEGKQHANAARQKREEHEKLRQEYKMVRDTSHRSTMYYQHAVALDGKKSEAYWGNDHELFARAFEAFVQDKLEVPTSATKAQRRNSYLVDGTRESYKTGHKVNEEHAQPYPQGAERHRINAAFERLLGVLHSTGTFKKALRFLSRPLTARPRGPKLVIA